MMPNSRFVPVILPLRAGSGSSAVRRSSERSAPIPLSALIALTGRSRKRLEWPAASAISLRPIEVSWSTFLPNSGELESSAQSSATEPSTLSPGWRVALLADPGRLGPGRAGRGDEAVDFVLELVFLSLLERDEAGRLLGL